MPYKIEFFKDIDINVQGLMLVSKLEKEAVKSDVILYFECQNITYAKCSTCSEVPWCDHIQASVMFRIHNEDKVEIILPLNKSLNMPRIQLQQLLKYITFDMPFALMSTCQFLVKNRNQHCEEQNILPDITIESDLNDGENLNYIIIRNFEKKLKLWSNWEPCQILLRENGNVLEKVFNALSIGNEEIVLEIFCCIAKSIMQSGNVEMDEYQQAIILPFERILACLILSDNISETFKENILNIAAEINLYFEDKNIKMFYKHEVFDVTRLCPMVLMSSEGIVDFSCLEAREYSTFALPLQCKKTMDLSQNTDLKQTNVMEVALHFDALYLLQNDEKSTVEMYRLGLQMLDILIPLCLKYSILSTIETDMDEDHEPSSPKRRKYEDEHECDKTKHQLTLLLLITVYRIAHSVKDENFYFNETTIVKSLLMSMELGRIKEKLLAESHIIDKQFTFLQKLQDEIEIFIIDKFSDFTTITPLMDNYKYALKNNDKLSFFGNCPPLHLIIILSKLSPGDDLVLKHTLPAKFMLCWNQQWCIRYNHEETQKSLRTIFKSVLAPLFLLQSKDNNTYYANILSEVVNVLHNCKKMIYQKLVADVLLDEMDITNTSPVEIIIELLFYLTLGNDIFYQFSLVEKFFLRYYDSCPCLLAFSWILPYWELICQKFSYSCKERLLNDASKIDLERQGDYLILIFEYFKQDNVEFSLSSVKLLDTISPRTEKEKALKIILENFKSFSPDALLKCAEIMQNIDAEISELQNDMASSETTPETNSALQISENTFKLLEASMQKSQECKLFLSEARFVWFTDIVSKTEDTSLINKCISILPNIQNCFEKCFSLQVSHMISRCAKRKNTDFSIPENVVNNMMDMYTQELKSILHRSTRITETTVKMVDERIKTAIDECEKTFNNRNLFSKLVVQKLFKDYTRHKRVKMLLKHYISE